MPVDRLDEACGVCERVAGDHTLREWATCLGTTTLDLPYEDTPPDVAATISNYVRRTYQLDDDVLVADHIVARALTLAGASGPVELRVPGLLHEFQIGIPSGPPAVVARVLFVGNPDSVRGYGRLIRDTANGAANAAERGAANGR
jgi:hypothetical protein